MIDMRIESVGGHFKLVLFIVIIVGICFFVFILLFSEIFDNHYSLRLPLYLSIEVFNDWFHIAFVLMLSKTLISIRLSFIVLIVNLHVIIILIILLSLIEKMILCLLSMVIIIGSVLFLNTWAAHAIHILHITKAFKFVVEVRFKKLLFRFII